MKVGSNHQAREDWRRVLRFLRKCDSATPHTGSFEGVTTFDSQANQKEMTVDLHSFDIPCRS